MSKEDLRRQLLSDRKSMSDKEHRLESELICGALRQLLDALSPTALHTFLAISKQKEADICPLLQSIWAQNITIYTSIVKKGHSHLQHVKITPKTRFISGPFSIPQPQAAELVSISQLKDTEKLIVLVPLLAFDLKGYRIGYGTGFYDRFLRLLPSAYSVGVSFFPPISSINPHALDVPMRACVTPTQTYILDPIDPLNQPKQ